MFNLAAAAPAPGPGFQELLPVVPVLDVPVGKIEDVLPQALVEPSKPDSAIDAEGNVKDGRTIESRGNINVKNVGNNATLKAGDLIIISGNVGDNCILELNGYAKIKGNVGEGCTITADQQILVDGTIGAGSKIITTRGWVVAEAIGDKVEITALKGGFSTKSVGEYVMVETGCDVKIAKEVPLTACIKKPINGHNYIAGQVYHEVSPEARAKAKAAIEAQRAMLQSMQMNQLFADGLNISVNVPVGARLRSMNVSIANPGRPNGVEVIPSQVEERKE